MIDMHTREGIQVLNSRRQFLVFGRRVRRRTISLSCCAAAFGAHLSGRVASPVAGRKLSRSDVQEFELLVRARRSFTRARR